MAGVLDELLQNVRQNDSDWKNAKDAIVRKGVPVPDGTPTSEYGEKILSIETGVDTSGDTVVPSALREGYTAHNAAGQAITGTIPDYSGGNTVEMTSPEGATLNTAGTYCEGNIEVVPKLQSKTATTGEIVKADDGYVGLDSVDTTPVYEAGKKSEYDAFWDVFQQNGNRKNYNFAFAGQGWSKTNFVPKYKVAPTAADRIFYGAFENQTGVFDFVKFLEENNITLDFSECTNFNYSFCYAYVTTLPEIDTRSAKKLISTFENLWATKTIEKIIFADDGSQTFERVFAECNVLTNLTIEGTIGQGGLNLSWSPLSKDSLISVINALSSTTTGLTVTLRLAAVNTAFETSAGAADGSTSEEWTALIATKPNWTINLINS